MPEHVWTNAKRDSVCAKCNTNIVIGQRILWSLVNRKDAWCEGCGNTIYTNNKGRGSTAEAGSAENPQRQSREESIKKAHEDNIAATYALINVVKELVNELKNINYHLTVRP